MTYTKEELTPHALELFREVREALPPEIGSRLRANRHFVTHGSFNSLFLFDVWDANHTDVLDRKHFKYCLGCDQRPNAKSHGYFHLWLNRIRIYRERESIVATLEREVPRLVPPGFNYTPHDRAFNVGMEFEYPSDLSELPDLLLPHYVALISAYHPLLMPIIDRSTAPLEPGERREVVAERGRIPFTPRGPHDRERVREYTRSIPPLWRAPILERFSYQCALCSADLRETGYHIDHIKAFSRGGTTTKDNLQPLCPASNLKKGNR